jgi:SanA protein
MILKLLKFLGKLILIVSIPIIIINSYINYNTSDYLYRDIQKLPSSTYALVLGTSKYLLKGGINVYYDERIEAAHLLLLKNKVDTLILSGDNRNENYDEPERMKQSLIEKGVDEKLIKMDTLGSRTYFSIENYYKKFKDESLTIVSQKFHNQRAVYIARKLGLTAIGFNAKSLPFYRDPITHIREWMAKMKAEFEIYFKGRPE